MAFHYSYICYHLVALCEKLGILFALATFFSLDFCRKLKLKSKRVVNKDLCVLNIFIVIYICNFIPFTGEKEKGYSARIFRQETHQMSES